MGTRRTQARGAVRSADPVARLATLRAEGQTVYWLAASGRDLAALLQGVVRDGVRTQAIRLLHRDHVETDAMYATRRAQEDDGG
jgi:hypothetical protein